MIKKTLGFQILVALGLLSLRWVFIFDILSFFVGFLVAQIYSWFFYLYLSQMLFKQKKLFAGLIICKWGLLALMTYGILKIIEPLGFFVGLMSMPTFFMILAYFLKRKA